ncbi:metal-dependent hydrolase [Hydrocarboniphaga sp.]|uniref:metal-dependent hydrolase n=1 Tax=Hydrocarboniphaga sp. TaxID=2033016 RepID=UPI003D11CDFB
MQATPIRRDLDFGIDRIDRKLAGRWHPRGVPVAHFYNAMSLFFPEGERFFIHSVRHFRERVADPELKAAITAFIGQEAMHGREHDHYNQLIREAGLPAEALERYTAALLGWLKDHLGPSTQLSITLALEHFTAMLAHLLLAEPTLLDGAEPKLKALWRWHAVEETEHKAVAFDVYQAAFGRGAAAYALRTSLFVVVMPLFLAHVLAYQAQLMKADEQRPRGVRQWLEFGRFLGGKRGLLTQMIKPGLAYFRPGFHPWDDDNRELLGAVEELAAAYAKPAAPIRRVA